MLAYLYTSTNLSEIKPTFSSTIENRRKIIGLEFWRFREHIRHARQVPAQANGKLMQPVCPIAPVLEAVILVFLRVLDAGGHRSLLAVRKGAKLRDRRQAQFEHGTGELARPQANFRQEVTRIWHEAPRQVESFKFLDAKASGEAPCPP